VAYYSNRKKDLCCLPSSRVTTTSRGTSRTVTSGGSRWRAPGSVWLHAGSPANSVDRLSGVSIVYRCSNCTSQVRQVAPVIFVAALSMLTGCQSYAPKPPDLATYHAAWLERSPASAKVSAYAEQFARPTAAADESRSGDELSLAQAEMVALVFNPELRLARSRAGVTRATPARRERSRSSSSASYSAAICGGSSGSSSLRSSSSSA
jgi:hypothetical protein